MFGRLKKDSKKENRNCIRELANKLLAEGKVDLLEDELRKIEVTSLSEKGKESWHEMYGIVAFCRNDREEALKRFQSAFEMFPNSVSIAYSLGQEYEYVGNTEKMVEMFDKSVFPELSSGHILYKARYAYLWNRYDKAIKYLSEIFKVYFDLKIVDDNFLYMRGLPFYGVVWSALGASYELTDNLNELKNKTVESKAKLIEYSFDDLLIFLDCIDKDNFERFYSIYDGRKNSNGYHLMRKAVIRSQYVDNAKKGEEILNSVRLENKDFPWLEDIRTLAKCNLAHKFSETEKEKYYKAEFFTKQPFLFEPEHIFNFRLVEYQEELKNDYQSKNRSREKATG